MLARVIFLVALCCVLPTWAADEAAQVRFLRTLFARPEGEWPELMERSREVLDDSFFERAESRIAWDLENNQVEDALRFALVCDLAARVQGRPEHHGQNLFNTIFSDEPPLMDMVNSQGEAINPAEVMIGDPQSRLNAAYYLVQQGELERAYRVFWEVRNWGHRPEQCVYEMAVIDRTRGEVECAWDEFDKLQQSGYEPGKCLYQKAMIDWDAGRKERSELEARQAILADPALEEARGFVDWLERR